MLISCAFSVAALTEMTGAEVRKVEFISERAKMLKGATKDCNIFLPSVCHIADWETSKAARHP